MQTLWNKKNSFRFLLIGILVAISIGGLFGEKIPVNNGTGWDGKHIAQLTIHFPELFASNLIDSYQYQRIFTPAVMYFTSRLLGYSLSNENIVQAYSFFNLCCILISVILYWRICALIKIHSNIEIIGFAALFFNYFTLKLTWYYPVLTDGTAFTFGMLLTYLYIAKKKIELVILNIIASVVFPLMFVISLPLALLQTNTIISHWLMRNRLFSIVPWIIGLLISAITCWIYIFPSSVLPKYALERNLVLVPIAIALTTWILFLFFKQIQHQMSNHQQHKKLINSVIPFLSMGIGVILIYTFIASHSIPEDVFTIQTFGLNLIQQNIDNPLAPVVAHVMYIGPGFLLIGMYYKEYITQVINWGDSSIVYLSICVVLLLLGSETRQFIHVFPFLMIMLIKTLSNFTIKLKQVLGFIALCLVMSKCWLPINREGIFSLYDYGHFPDQLYFMNQGPFCSDLGYWIHVACVMVALFILWRLRLINQIDKST
jgi:hypothetical protein